MATYSTPPSPPTSDHVSSSKRRRSGTLTSLDAVSSLPFDMEIRRLKEQLSESQTEVSHLRKEIIRMKEDAAGQDELKNLTQKTLENEKRRSDKALEEARKRINDLRKDLAATRESLHEAEEKLISKEKWKQAWLNMPYSGNDRLESRVEPPSLSETDDDTTAMPTFKTENEMMISEDSLPLLPIELTREDVDSPEIMSARLGADYFAEETSDSNSEGFCRTERARDKHASSTTTSDLTLIRMGMYCCLVSKRFTSFNFHHFYDRLKEKNGSTTFTCKLCDPNHCHVTYLKQGMEDHIWAIHENEKFHCPYCRKLYKLRMSLVQHAKVTHRNLGVRFSGEAERKYGEVHT